MKIKHFLLAGAFTIFAGHRTLADQTSNSVAHGSSTTLEVVTIQDYKFTADSFFGERTGESFQEVPAKEKYMNWAQKAVSRVNSLIPKEYWLPKLKLKLIFEAEISPTSGPSQRVPISIIESYQEAKTASVRLGMLELKDSKLSFQLTVAHEYSHLIFESASRTAGSTPPNSDFIGFWPKSVYEGLADLFMAMAMNSDYSSAPDDWSARYLFEYKTLSEAKASKDNTVSRAKAAFQKMGLIPQYAIYSDWLAKVGQFIESQGGVDPYAEGTWVAGTLLKAAKATDKRQRLARSLIARAKSGAVVHDLQEFVDQLKLEIARP